MFGLAGQIMGLVGQGVNLAKQTGVLDGGQKQQQTQQKNQPDQANQKKEDKPQNLIEMLMKLIESVLNPQEGGKQKQGALNLLA